MALNLALSTDYGVQAAYHKVATARVEYGIRTVFVTLVSYADVAARQADMLPLLTRPLSLSFEALADTTEPTRTQIYDALKALPAWAGAEDC